MLYANFRFVLNKDLLLEKNSSILKFTLNKEHYLEKIVFWGFLGVIFRIHKILTDFKY